MCAGQGGLVRRCRTQINPPMVTILSGREGRKGADGSGLVTRVGWGGVGWGGSCSSIRVH